jgi:recombination protein RecA
MAKKAKAAPKKEGGDGSLAAFRANLAKEHKSSVVNFDEQVDAYPTGILELDVALGTGGFPQGRVLEIYGPPSGGKTAMALIAAGEAQRRSKKAVLYVDTEGNSDAGFLSWAQKLGVAVSEAAFVPAQPESGEEAFQIIEKAINSKLFCHIIVDSLAGLVSMEELKKDFDDNTTMGVRARLLHAAMRKLTRPLAQSGTTLIFINQVYTAPGIRFGNPERTPGGMAVKFYAAQRLRVSPEWEGEEKQKGQIVGHTVKVKVEKNKCAPPKRTAIFALNYFTGVDRIKMLVRAGNEMGILSMKGTAVSYGDMSLGADRVDVTETLTADPILRDEIEHKVREALLEKARGGDVVGPEVAEEQPEE